jgi:hypothetical protein
LHFGLLAHHGDKPDPMEPDAMNTPNPTTPIKRKNPDTLRRYKEGDDGGIAPTPGTIKHDNLAGAYRRGAVDALRAVMIAAQAALAKREGGQ